MTADVKLLPLYAELQGHPKLEIIKHYARACVAHATAEKDAEIEALRAINDNREAIIATHAADTREYQKQIMHAEARAERMAEALRFYADTNNWVGRFVTDPTTPAEEDGGDNARESLRDHDQETGNG